MKVKITIPCGAEINIERQPLEPYKFYTLCWALCLAVVLPAFFSIFR